MLKPGDKLICVLNRRTVYSYIPRLYVGETYTYKSEHMFNFIGIPKIELCEHPGFYYEPDVFLTTKQIRNKKLKTLNNL